MTVQDYRQSVTLSVVKKIHRPSFNYAKNLVTDAKYHRHIRSFALREGRMTTGQLRAMDLLWPRWGVVIDDHTAKPIDTPALFARDAPLTLEIGFGNGTSLAAMADAQRNHDFIGVEVHGPGVGHLLVECEERELTNVRAIKHDAVEIIRDFIAPESLDRVLIFFADPWHKRKHHKRRIIQPKFVELIRKRLKPGGILHMATDWEDYAKHQLKVMEAAPGWGNLAGVGNYSPKPDYRPETKFERRGLGLGHGVWDLLYQRN